MATLAVSDAEAGQELLDLSGTVGVVARWAAPLTLGVGAGPVVAEGRPDDLLRPAKR
ncbi:MAG: hypothetical protein ACK4XJ_04230 [Fimbriimonadaceae bacterium]